MLELDSGLLLPIDEVPGWHGKRREQAREFWLSQAGRSAPRRFAPMKGGANQPYRTPQLPIMVTSQAAVAGTGEAALWPVSPFTAVAANTAFGGQMWSITAFGVMTTAASAPGTLTVTPRWGTTTGGLSLGISAASATLGVSQTGVPWYLEAAATIRAVSSTASASTMVLVGSLAMPPGVLASGIVFGGTVVTTADTTSAQGWFIGVTLGSASDSMTTLGVAAETLN